MTKLKNFVRLDFVTVKPYFTAKNLLIYAIIAVFLTVMSGNIGSCMGIGLMLGTLFVSHPFALSDKSNLDALYATLSVDRKTVVLGRYLFVLALNLCAIFLSTALAAIGLLVVDISGFATGAGEAIWVAIVLASVFLVIQSIQLPLYFKYGYAKAKFFSLVPFAALMAGFLAFTTIAKDSEMLAGASGFFESFIYSGFWTIPLVALFLLLILFVSYTLSLKFYLKREF